jgi:hypothetical protein
MLFMLSTIECPIWPCEYYLIGIVSAIVGGVVGYRLGLRARTRT